MYCHGKDIAMDHNGFDILVRNKSKLYCTVLLTEHNLLKVRLLERVNPKILVGAIRCLMEITSTTRGKELAYQANIMPLLNRILHDEVSVFNFNKHLLVL